MLPAQSFVLVRRTVQMERMGGHGRRIEWEKMRTASEQTPPKGIDHSWQTCCVMYRPDDTDVLSLAPSIIRVLTVQGHDHCEAFFFR